MGATLAIVVILAIVLGLILVLLAELYCSILLRRRKFNDGNQGSAPENPTSPQQPQHQQLVPSPLSSFYAQGVLEAPRSFLFPKLPSKREKHGKLHQFLRIQSPQVLGLASTSSSPPLNKTDEIKVEIEEKDFMYISNPMYDNEVARPIQMATPFETPDSSPSHLDQNGSSGGGSSPSSLPLSPMKELTDKAASVSLKDAGCLGTCSESNSHVGRSSSSSESPRTSPSW